MLVQRALRAWVRNVNYQKHRRAAALDRLVCVFQQVQASPCSGRELTIEMIRLDLAIYFYNAVCLAVFR